MGYFPHGAAAAAHQARKRREEQQEEEETMTNYTKEDLEANWEFKIVRSETGAFRKPEVFQMLLQEESIAGWELVEKLDDRRVRFKRPASARRRDATLPPGVDPYRSIYGNATARTTMMITIAILLASGVGLGVIGAAGNGEFFSKFTVIAPLIIIGITFTVMIALIIQRRR
jgi:hypothetical protein